MLMPLIRSPEFSFSLFRIVLSFSWNVVSANNGTETMYLDPQESTGTAQMNVFFEAVLILWNWGRVHLFVAGIAG